MTDTPPLTPRRERSPSYPGIGLETAIERARIIWDKEHRHAAPVSNLYRHWNYKGATGPSMTTLSALLKFGLLDDEGSGDKRTAILTDDALAILLAPSADHPDRLRAIREAALKPSIHAELRSKYGVELPSDQTIHYYLVRERKFTEGAAWDLIKEYRATMAFAGLLESDTVSGDGETPPPPEDEMTGGGPADEMVRDLLAPPKTPPVALPDTIRFPFAGRWASLNLPLPLTEAQYDQLLAILDALKPELLRNGDLTEG